MLITLSYLNTICTILPGPPDDSNTNGKYNTLYRRMRFRNPQEHIAYSCISRMYADGQGVCCVKFRFIICRHVLIILFKQPVIHHLRRWRIIFYDKRLYMYEYNNNKECFFYLKHLLNYPR